MAPPMAAELLSQLEEWIDDLLMSNRFFYFAGRAAGSIPRRTRATEWVQSPKTLERELQELGYDAEHDCPWRRLGVPQLEGPPPEL